MSVTPHDIIPVRQNAVARQRNEELKLLAKLRKEAAMKERYPHQ